MTLSNEQINCLIGVTENYKAPDTLMAIILDKSKREALFQRFLALENDLSYDWFREYFQSQQADRGQKKQDFTPVSLSKLVAMLVGDQMTTMDFATGTGGLTIQKWWSNRQGSQVTNEFYWLEEITEAAIPFLLFNCLIRGMNAVVINGDTLERTANQVYLLEQNEQPFSQLKVLPHTPEVAAKYELHSWTAQPGIGQTELLLGDEP